MELSIPPIIEFLLAVLALIVGFGLVLIALGFLSLLLPAIIAASVIWLLTRDVVLAALVFTVTLFWTFSARKGKIGARVKP